MIKNIVFDLGGVVLDWSPKKVEKEYPGNMELPQFLFKTVFFQKYWTEFDRGMLSEKELVHEMVEHSGYPMEECYNFIEFIKYSLTDIQETIHLIKKMSAAGYKLYCLSNMSIEFYNYLKPREVFRFFDGQIISGLVKLVKPNDAIYRLLLKQYNLKAGESMFIDDLEANVKAAAALGFYTVHFADREKGYQMITQLLNANGNGMSMSTEYVIETSAKH